MTRVRAPRSVRSPPPAPPPAPTRSPVAERMQPFVIDPEVMSDLVHHGDLRLRDHVLPRLAHPQGRPPVDRDPIRQHPRVPLPAVGQGVPRRARAARDRQGRARPRRTPPRCPSAASAPAESGPAPRRPVPRTPRASSPAHGHCPARPPRRRVGDNPVRPRIPAATLGHTGPMARVPAAVTTAISAVTATLTRKRHTLPSCHFRRTPASAPSPRNSSRSRTRTPGRSA